MTIKETLNQDNPYIVASVDRALELLLLMGKTPGDMGVTEISRLLGVQKSTVYCLLQTLMNKEFVHQTDNARYTLGLRLIELGQMTVDRLDVETAAKPIMDQLAEQTGEVALLAVLSNSGELIIISKSEPQRPFLIIPKFDFSIAVHSTSVGKVLLSYADEATVDAVLHRGVRRYTSFTLTDSAAIKAELARVRSQGFAVGCNETIDGVTCVAVPVFNVRKEVAASLSVSSVSSVLTADRYGDIVTLLKEKALLISRRLGYTE